MGAGTARCDRKSSIGRGMKYRTLRFLGVAAVSFIISPCVSLAQIAGAAQLVMGKTDGIQAAIVRGLDVRGDGRGRDLLMPRERDIFR